MNLKECNEMTVKKIYNIYSVLLFVTTFSLETTSTGIFALNL